MEARKRYNLTPSDSQNEQDQKQILHRPNHRKHMKKSDYEGIRIQISKEKRIQHHLVERPIFLDNQRDEEEGSPTE